MRKGEKEKVGEVDRERKKKGKRDRGKEKQQPEVILL